MALNIKNQEVDKLLEAVVQITGESKTEAVRKALEERRQRLALHFGAQPNKNRLHLFLQEEVWPQVPAEWRYHRLTKAEEEAILGYGEHGV